MGEPNGNGDRFLGLNAYWKQWANMGLAGVFAGLLIWFAMTTRADHREDARAQREDMRAFREEASRAHGTMSDLVRVIQEERATTRGLARAVQELAAELRKAKEQPELELVPNPD